MKSPHFTFLICIWKIKYWTMKFTKIVTIFILLEFNCNTQFPTCCADWDKVSVKFVTPSMLYAKKWEQFSLVWSLSLKKKGFRPVGLRFRPQCLRFRPVDLRFRLVGLCFRLVGLCFGLVGLCVRLVGLRFRPQCLRFRQVDLRFRLVGLCVRPVGLRFGSQGQMVFYEPPFWESSRRKPLGRGWSTK